MPTRIQPRKKRVLWRDWSPQPRNRTWCNYVEGRQVGPGAPAGFEWIGWYDLTDEEYEAEFAARKARQGAATNQQQQPPGGGLHRAGGAGRRPARLQFVPPPKR